MVQPTYQVDDWFHSEAGQKDWLSAMELDTLTPDLPELLVEMGIKYDPDKLASQLSSKWPQVGEAGRQAAAAVLTSRHLTAAFGSEERASC